MTTPPWYVITGGPCAGKTTLIRELGRRGYRTVPEAARTHIEEGFAEGKTIGEIRKDETEFQRTVLARKIATERTLSRNEVLFFDRGMHDSAAYLELLGMTAEPTLESALRDSTYRRVFVLDLLPYEPDDVRVEDETAAQHIQERLTEAYTRACIPVLQVPIMPVEERADFVLANL